MPTYRDPLTGRLFFRASPFGPTSALWSPGERAHEAAAIAGMPTLPTVATPRPNRRQRVRHLPKQRGALPTQAAHHSGSDSHASPRPSSQAQARSEKGKPGGKITAASQMLPSHRVPPAMTVKRVDDPRSPRLHVDADA